MKKSIIYSLLTLSLVCLQLDLLAQKYIEVNDIRYRVILEADEAHTYGTVSVARLEFGEYEGEIVIPNVVKESDDKYADAYKVIGIDDRAFLNAKYLESVQLPASLETMGHQAFCGSSLPSIKIPTGNLKEIGEGAFARTNIVSIDIPSTVKRIGNAAFSGCVQLESVTFHDGLEYIGGEAFSDCMKLQSLRFPKTLKSIEYRAFSNCLYLNHVEVNDGLKFIGGNAFNGCIRLRQFRLPESLKEIQVEAFSYTGITEIAIPKSIRYIPSGSFEYSMIRNVQLPDKIEVYTRSFTHCRLDNVTIPATITIDSANVFKGSIFGAHQQQVLREKYVKDHKKEILKWSVKYAELKMAYSSIDNQCKGEEERRRAVAITYEINGLYFTPIQHPTSQEEYGLLAVVAAKDVSGSVTIPDVVEITEGPYEEKYIVCEIGCSAFYHQNVTEAVLPMTLEYIGPVAFSDCPLSKITLPESLERIGAGCFQGCQLTEITIPKKVALIDDDAFSCKSLTTVNILGDPSKIMVGHGIFGNNRDLKINTVTK